MKVGHNYNTITTHLHHFDIYKIIDLEQKEVYCPCGILYRSELRMLAGHAKHEGLCECIFINNSAVGKHLHLFII